MMNKILRNLINTREVASFINNVIVGTEEKKGYDKIVEEVVKRLTEKNLYMKLEKYKQKVREIGVLGVVIKLEEIKIEQEKMKAVLDWPILDKVKNVQKFLGLANYYKQFVSQTLFSLYFHNQQTGFHKISCAGKLQMMAICTYAGCIKATTNN